MRRGTDTIITTLICLAGGIVILAAGAFTALPTAAAPTELCGKDARQAVAGGYEISPNIWNSGGELCLTTDGQAGFTVSKSTINSGNVVDANRGPGAYPYIGTTADDQRFPIAADKIGGAAVNWSVVAPDSGSYNAAYDIWYAPTAEACGNVITSATSTEVMVWLKSPGLDPPADWLIAKGVSIGDVTYDVYQFTGPTGQNALIYQVVTPVNSLYLKLAPLTQDAISRGKLSAQGVLCRVQAGFEIHADAPELKTTNFLFSTDGQQDVAPTGTAEPAPSTTAAGEQTLFEDDFDGAEGELPSAEWSYDLGHQTQAPNGQRGPMNFGTGEIARMTNDPANVSTDGEGHLRITPLRSKTGEWTSARIGTTRNFTVPEGTITAFEARIRMPQVTGEKARGYWPAFWLLNEPQRTNPEEGHWPKGGEIDIVENVNGENRAHMTLHCGVENGGPCNENMGRGTSVECAPASCSADFHTYRVEFDRTGVDQLRWYLNGTLTHQLSRDQAPDGTDLAQWQQAWDQMIAGHGFFAILNIAVGGGMPAGNGGDVSAATEPGHSMLIDYVKITTQGGEQYRTRSTPCPTASTTTPEDSQTPQPSQAPTRADSSTSTPSPAPVRATSTVVFRQARTPDDHPPHTHTPPPHTAPPTTAPPAPPTSTPPATPCPPTTPEPPTPTPTPTPGEDSAEDTVSPREEPPGKGEPAPKG